MSNIKKLLALVLALTMVLSVSAFAGYTVAPYGDAAQIDEDCEVAVQTLYSLDIMKGDDKGNYNPEATITRAEMAKIIYVILNYGDDDKAVNYTGANIFSDVKAGDWYEGYVNYAATIKLVQGRGDGTFAPNAPITTAEAAKMLLTAIGYSAEARGYVGAGWDKQVLSDASIIGLLDDYNYNTTGYAPRQWVAVMVLNALTKAYTYGNIAPVVFNGLLTGVNYDAEYVNFGWKYFGLYEWKGIITANEYADLYGDETLSASNTQINKGEYKFKNWTTDLTEIGEYRWGYAVEDGSKDKVVYVGGEDENTEFSTGAGIVIKKANISGIKLDKTTDPTEYYMNFAVSTTVKANYETENGDWVRVVDNNDDGYADYVFVTEFEMTQIDDIHKDGTVTLANTEASDEFEIYEDAAEGDIVLYTVIDKVEYVTLAESFTGEVDKYTYKTETLTVDGEDYPQSYIKVTSIEDEYFTILEDAAKKTEYTYYLDFFGNIRAFGEDVADAGDLVLLTDAYYETNRSGSIAAVDAYLDGELKDTDVRNSATYTDIEEFINTRTNSSNGWNRLIEYKEDATAWTNIARYTMSDEDVMSLYTAQTWKYTTKGAKDYIKTDYIDLDEVDVDAGETTYTGKYYTYKTVENADGTKSVVVDKTYDVKVQANRNTVFYYVDEDLNIKSVVGYKNSLDVIDEIAKINAIYAVGTNVSGEFEQTDADDNYKYWVADVIVVETKYPVFNLDSNVVLGYNAVNKTVNDYAALDVIGADGAEDVLNVISLDGDSYNKYEAFNDAADINVPSFYWNTEDEDGESYIIEIEKDYAKYGIYAETLNRVNKLDEYVVMADGEVLYYDENTVVYDMYAGKRYVAVTTEDDYEDTLELTTGKDYILYVNSDDVIVYAILVDATYTTDAGEVKVDVARELFDAIVADANPVVTPVIDPIAKALEKAAEVLAGTDVNNMKAAIEDLTTLADRFEDLTVVEQEKATELIEKLTAKVELADAQAAYDALIDATVEANAETASAWPAGAAEAAKIAVAEALADKTAEEISALTPAKGDDIWNNAIVPVVVELQGEAAEAETIKNYKALADAKAAEYMAAAKVELAEAPIAYATNKTVADWVKTAIVGRIGTLKDYNMAEFTVTVTAPADVVIGNGQTSVQVEVSVTNTYDSVTSDAVTETITVLFTR